MPVTLTYHKRMAVANYTESFLVIVLEYRVFALPTVAILIEITDGWC
jgi:hypothetical protein